MLIRRVTKFYSKDLKKSRREYTSQLANYIDLPNDRPKKAQYHIKKKKVNKEDKGRPGS